MKAPASIWETRDTKIARQSMPDCLNCFRAHSKKEMGSGFMGLRLALKLILEDKEKCGKQQSLSA